MSDFDGESGYVPHHSIRDISYEVITHNTLIPYKFGES